MPLNPIPVALDLYAINVVCRLRMMAVFTDGHLAIACIPAASKIGPENALAAIPLILYTLHIVQVQYI